MDKITIKHGNSFHAYDPIVPAHWHGEVNCVIGPFSSQQVAEYYAKVVVDFGQLEVSQRIFANRDAWYIEAQQLSVWIATTHEA
jgi:hypothetical protein